MSWKANFAKVTFFLFLTLACFLAGMIKKIYQCFSYIVVRSSCMKTKQWDQGKDQWRKRITNTDNKEETAAIYDEIASFFEQDLPLEKKIDAVIIAKQLDAVFRDRKDIRILDVAAGTGYVGGELKKVGFTNIDALDGSARMLEIAKGKQYYKNYFCNFFTKDSTPGLVDGLYDALVSTGAFLPCHLNADCFVECLRLTKSGGYIILGAYDWPDRFGDDFKIQERLHDVIQAQSTLCEVVKLQKYEEYGSEGHPGTTFTVMKL